MSSVHLGEAIQTTSAESKLDELAKQILMELETLLKDVPKFLVKLLLGRVKKRLEKNKVDDAAFGYIVRRFLTHFDAPDDLDAIFEEALGDEKKEKADLIVYDIQAVLNGNLLKIFAKDHAADDFVRYFETMMTEAGIEQSKAVDLAKMVWAKVQSRFGV